MKLLKCIIGALALGMIVTNTPVAASAGTAYVCQADAVKLKKDYVVSQFKDYIGGKYKNTGGFEKVLTKVWDGKGDCDPNTDAGSKLPPEALLNLVLTHYYGDIMTVSAYVAAGKVTDVRNQMDDYKQVHSLITNQLKKSFDDSFFKEDKNINSTMRDYDTQITKAGAKTKVTEKI